jgi:hypothetical protein
VLKKEAIEKNFYKKFKKNGLSGKGRTTPTRASSSGVFYFKT